MTSNLLDVLRLRQKELIETDDEFAGRLGISREMWRLVRLGRTEPGRRTLRGIIAAFPELTDSVHLFILSRNASILANMSEPSRAEAAPA